jgi:rhamnogalacturonyl hydrolase YesR
MAVTSPLSNLEQPLATAAEQYHRLLADLGAPVWLPRSFDGTVLKRVTAADWTSGFFPGSLWLLYEATGEAHWRAAAEAYTALLAPQQHNRGTHDIGFMMHCSFGNGWRLEPRPEYRDVLINAARALASRFHPVVGCIRSWDEHRWEFPVIIDNMMNLELLFWAARETGERRFAEIAVHHADRTLEAHFRADGSCCHVVGFDPHSGAALEQATHQGYSAESAWARGQAWAVYGYTLCYRFTRDAKYREVAERSAQFMLDRARLPADLVPYWDYNDPRIPEAPRDASAAAVLASGLLELSQYSVLSSPKFRRAAGSIVTALSAPPYLSAPGENGGFILGHCVGSVPHQSEIDVPLVYADYYFLEALLRWRRLEASQPVD